MFDKAPVGAMICPASVGVAIPDCNVRDLDSQFYADVSFRGRLETKPIQGRALPCADMGLRGSGRGGQHGMGKPENRIWQYILPLILARSQPIFLGGRRTIGNTGTVFLLFFLLRLMGIQLGSKFGMVFPVPLVSGSPREVWDAKYAEAPFRAPCAVSAPLRKSVLGMLSMAANPCCRRNSGKLKSRAGRCSRRLRSGTYLPRSKSRSKSGKYLA